MNLRLVREWWDVSLGDLDVRRTLRESLWGLVEMVLGVQTAYGAFFLSLLTMWPSVSERDRNRPDTRVPESAHDSPAGMSVEIHRPSPPAAVVRGHAVDPRGATCGSCDRAGEWS